MSRQLHMKRTVRKRELTLRLVVEQRESVRTYWIQPNPFLVYASLSDTDRIAVRAAPVGEPALLVVRSAPAGKAHSFGEASDAIDNGILRRLPRRLDPVGYAAREYAKRTGLKSLGTVAYHAGWQANLSDHAVVPIQLYRFKRC